jgi:UDP-glucose 4-epimerase
MLRDACAASTMRSVILRYFNVAGCDPDGEIGQSTTGATLLIKVACEAATGTRDVIHVFGTDYDTPDGTGIRDYIHVQDLAAAHLGAMNYLKDGAPSVTLNCGYGHGYSVREVLDTVQQVAERKLNIVESGRRAGDPPMLIADSTRLRSLFDWQPRYDDLTEIVRNALFWERKIAAKQVRDGRAVN